MAEPIAIVRLEPQDAEAKDAHAENRECIICNMDEPPPEDRSANFENCTCTSGCLMHEACWNGFLKHNNLQLCPTCRSPIGQPVVDSRIELGVPLVPLVPPEDQRYILCIPVNTHMGREGWSATACCLGLDLTIFFSLLVEILMTNSSSIRWVSVILNFVFAYSAISGWMDLVKNEFSYIYFQLSRGGQALLFIFHSVRIAIVIMGVLVLSNEKDAWSSAMQVAMGSIIVELTIYLFGAILVVGALLGTCCRY